MAEFHSLEEARTFFEQDRFATENGMALDTLTEDGAVCSMTLTERHRNAEGAIMGGVIMTLIDFTFAAASCNAHRPTVAQQVSISFLNAARGNRLEARATCRKDGKNSCVYLVEVTDDLGREVAQALETGFKLPKK